MEILLLAVVLCYIYGKPVYIDRLDIPASELCCDYRKDSRSRTEIQELIVGLKISIKKFCTH